MQKDYYRILEIEEKATITEIKKAYRRLAFKYHPDRNRGGISGEDRFRDIKEAFEILSDPIKRNHYNAGRRAQSVWAPSYEFAKYDQPFPMYKDPDDNPDKNPEEEMALEEWERREKKRFIWLLVKPMVLILVAIILMALIMNPPQWLLGLLGK